LLFADDLTFSSFTNNDLYKAINQVTKYCTEWNLKYNIKKTKILGFKNGDKPKNDESWVANHQEIEVADEVNYLEITFERSDGWKRQKLKIRAKVNQTLVAIDKFFARSPDLRVKILENLYEMLDESRMLCGIEILRPRWSTEINWQN
jgi:hypothetical protein